MVASGTRSGSERTVNGKPGTFLGDWRPSLVPMERVGTWGARCGVAVSDGKRVVESCSTG